MEIGSTSLLGFGSRCCSRVLVLPLVLLCCPLVCCCLGAAAFFTNSPDYNVRPLPGIDDFPPVVTVPAIPVIPSKTPAPGSLLDPESPPLFGSASLESGFSPDPYRAEAEAGGSVDTADFSPACGYTSFHPVFALDWQASDTEPFLRLFFTPDDDIDTTLLVHTPGDEWLCEENAALDLPSASSGEYAIWLGTREKGTLVEGRLSITGSEDVIP
jgi:hypothetical protein